MGEVRRVGAWVTMLRVRLASKPTVTTTMERRKFVIGAGALATGSAAAVGSGAFTSVDASRDAEVNVAADNAAYLALSSDGEYVEDDGDEGEITIDLGGPTNDSGGEGFNEDAVTVVEGVFDIDNQGTQDATVGFGDVDDPSEDTSFDIAAGEDGAEVTLTIQEQSVDAGHGTSVDAEVDTTADPGDPDPQVSIDIVANEDA